MKRIGWLFPPRNGGNETGYTNQGIEGFKGEDLIDNLTREICQNSLDAGRGDASGPVEVDFNLVQLEKSKYPIFAEYAECIEGCKQYWGSRMDDKLRMFISGAEETLSHDSITMFIASDSNTSGLTGVNATRDQKSVWRGLVQSDGASVKDGDSAGSYGIGKNAPFACSSLSMVLYNTYAVDDVRAFQGVARAATLIQNGKSTQSIGHYKVIDDDITDEDIATPVTPDDNCLIRDKFNRTEYGTDVGIVGFNAYDNWEDNIIKAVLKNFFLAVKEEKLTVKVNGVEIKASNLEETFKKYLDDKKVAISYEMYSAVISPDAGTIYKNSVLQTDDIEMYLKVDSNYNRNIGNFRNTGMLVGQCRKNTLQRFSAVVVVRGKELGMLLKDAEPAKHNKWDANIINNKDRKKAARDAINTINAWIEKILNERFAVPMDKSVDSDMGEYLPYEIGDVAVGTGSEGKDKLKVKQKISEVKPIPIVTKSTEEAGKTTGKKVEGEPHNKDDIPDPPIPPEPKPPVVDPDVDGNDEGVGKGSGKKTISFPKVLGQRVSPRNYNQGVYHGVLKLEKDSDNIYLQFSTVDADYRQDDIKVITYVANGESHKNVNTEKIGPISIKKGEFTDVSLVFDCHEKVVVKMSVTEER